MKKNYHFEKYILDNGIEVFINKTNKTEFIPLAIEFKICSPLNFNPSAVNLLSRQMVENSSRYGSKSELKKALEMETNTVLYSSISKRGMAQIATIGLNMLKDDYLNPGRAPLEKRLQFLGDAIFMKDINERLLEIQKGVAEYDITSIIEDPEEFASKRFFETFFTDQDIVIDVLGTIEGIQKTDREMLLDAYDKILTGSNIKIFVCDSMDDNLILSHLSKMFSGIKKGERQAYELYVPNVTVSSKEKDVTEFADVKQAVVCIGYKVEEIEPLGKEWMAFRILNNIVNDRLEESIREDKGLVYALYSYYSTWFNRLVVQAGFKPGNEALLKELVEQEIKKIKKEKIREEEFNNVKEYCLMIITGYWFDNQKSRIETAELFLSLNKLDRMNNFVDEINSVTFEDVVGSIDKIDGEDRVSYLRVPK